MSRLSREQLVGSGAIALFLTLIGLAGGEQQVPVAHAALNMLNNRPPEHTRMQTIPPLPTSTPTVEVTPTPLPPNPTQTPTPESTPTPLPPNPTQTPTPEFTPEPTPDTRPACVADILGFDQEGNPGTVPLQLNEPDGHVLQVGGVQSYGLETGSTLYAMGGQLPFTFTGQLDTVGGYSVVVFDNTAECQIESVQVAANNPVGGYGEITVDEAIPRLARSSQAGTATKLESGAQLNQDGTVSIHVADLTTGVTIDAQMDSGAVGYSPNTPDSFQIQGESSAAVVQFSSPDQNGDIIPTTIELGAINPDETQDLAVSQNEDGQTEVVISTDTDNDGTTDIEKTILDGNGDGILTPDEEVPPVTEYEIHFPFVTSGRISGSTGSGEHEMYLPVVKR